MKLLLFSLLGMILLILIVSFVPLQLNRQLKFPLIVSSFLLAVFWGWAQQYMPLTNTISILVLLAVLVTYVIGKRIAHQPLMQESLGNAISLEAEAADGISLSIESEDSPSSSQASENSLATSSTILQEEEELIRIIEDTLPELEDLTERLPPIEHAPSDPETSEEELLKKRRLLFDILELPADDQQLEDIGDDAELSTGTKRPYNKR